MSILLDPEVPRCGRLAVLRQNLSEPLRRQVYLVPGFLGFDSLGKQDYFTDVDQLLCPPGTEVISTDTEVSSSLARRAERLARIVIEKFSEDIEQIHFVGHSTGGLDVRTLLSPDSGLLEDLSFEDASNWEQSPPGSHAARLRRAVEATRSLTCVATPHYGTPLADLGAAVWADRWLLGAGRWIDRHRERLRPPLGNLLGALRRLPRAPTRWSNLRALQLGLLEVDALELVEYLAEFGLDTGIVDDLLTQARAESDPKLGDRAGVSYFDLVTGVGWPRQLAGEGLTLARGPLFRLQWQIVGRPYPGWSAAHREQLLERRELDAELELGSFDLPPVDSRWPPLPNDGVIPTYAQVHGEVLAVVAADHLDPVGFYPHCIGELDQPAGQPCQGERGPASSWIRSGANYDNARHKLVWGRVLEAMLASE